MSVSEVLQLVTAMAAVVATVVSWHNKTAIQEVHLSLNSRLDQLLKQARALGITEGRDQPKE
jgi:hypothetical protein